MSGNNNWTRSKGFRKPINREKALYTKNQLEKKNRPQTTPTNPEDFKATEKNVSTDFESKTVFFKEPRKMASHFCLKPKFMSRPVKYVWYMVRCYIEDHNDNYNYYADNDVMV